MNPISNQQSVKVTLHRRKDAEGYAVKIALLEGEQVIKESCLPLEGGSFEDSKKLGQDIFDLIMATGDPSPFFPDDSSPVSTESSGLVGDVVQGTEGRA